MASGIYSITNLKNGKVLIGCSKNVYTRKNCHFHYLRNNKHGNAYLQAAWNKDSEANFEYKVLELCESDSLFELEDKYCKVFNSHDRNFGYNIKPTGVVHNNTLSVETIEKIRVKTIKRLSKKVSRIKIANGVSNYFKGAGREKLNRKGSTPKVRIVFQYTLNGTWVNTYSNIKEASEATNIKEVFIRSNANEYVKTAGSFVWIYKYKIERKDEIIKWANSTPKKAINQYDNTGNFIKQWDSARELSRTLNVDRSDVIKSCKSDNKKVKGYRFQYAQV